MGGKMVRFQRGGRPHGTAFDSMGIDEDAVVPPGDRWVMVDDPWVWRIDCTPDEAARLAAICRKYGVAYTIDGKPGGKAKAEPSPLSLRKWAGLRHATVREQYQRRSGSETGERVTYQCRYDGHFGPVRRNPIAAMEAAKAADEARRAKGGGK